MTTISTWNVNSVRSRITHITDWLQTNPVDVLCLQETKVVDADFPRPPFEGIGYQVEIFGQKAYNGVALVSKHPLTKVQVGFTPVLEAIAPSLEEANFFDQQKRVITGITQAGIRVVNLYVPNGSSVDSEKYDYKLRWFKLLKLYIQQLQAAGPQEIVICGDFNIALEDRDIYKSKGLEQHIMSSPAEREALRSVLELGFADAFRKFTDEPGHYSWWNYRAASFSRNMGWRIDHHYLTPDLYERAISCRIDKTPRGLEKPSDHTPVTVEIQD